MRTASLLKKIPPFLLAVALLSGCSHEPRTRTLDVPFTSQAPDGNWNEPWQNACEETAIAMVDAFYAGEVGLPPREAAHDILRIFNVKNDRLGSSADESVETMARLVAELGLDWQAHVVLDPTVEALEAEVDAKRPVIIPVFAPTLRNKVYEVGELDYHVVVLIGYDETRNEFIVHDPGTASGQGLRFSYEVLMDAMHDLHPENYRIGRKAVVFTTGSASSSPI